MNSWHTFVMNSEKAYSNPFLALKFYNFAVISALVLAFFPVSFALCWLVFGAQVTRDLIEAMVRDWIQTMLILVSLLTLIFGGAIWGVMQWIGV